MNIEQIIVVVYFLEYKIKCLYFFFLVADRSGLHDLTGTIQVLVLNLSVG